MYWTDVVCRSIVLFAFKVHQPSKRTSWDTQNSVMCRCTVEFSAGGHINWYTSSNWRKYVSTIWHFLLYDWPWKPILIQSISSVLSEYNVVKIGCYSCRFEKNSLTLGSSLGKNWKKHIFFLKESSSIVATLRYDNYL